MSDPDDRIAQTVPFFPPVPQDLTDELVLDAMRRLPTAFQEVILLCDVEDLSYGAHRFGHVILQYRGRVVSLLFTMTSGRQAPSLQRRFRM